MNRRLCDLAETCCGTYLELLRLKVLDIYKLDMTGCATFFFRKNAISENAVECSSLVVTCRASQPQVNTK